MQLVTFNEVLSSLCDVFDTLISPKTIARTNSNVIYLMFKAVAKGYEVINNICVVLNNKFDPANCTEDDLNSVATLVGTEKLAGSASGLVINVYNDNDLATTITKGFYYYALDDDTTFVFEVLADTEISPESTVQYIATSEEIGSFSVTEQTSIEITSENIIPSTLKFSCQDNSSLLGTAEETNLEFRKRILTDTTRQDSIAELETSLKNQPYLFDAKIKFNNTLAPVTIDGITIPSYYMAIFYSGAPRNEIAELVCKKSVFPTVATSDSTAVYYTSDVFADGNYTVNIIPFKKTNYSISVQYTYNPVYALKGTVESAIKSLLKSTLNTNLHKDYVRESEVYTALENLTVQGVEILNVELYDSDGTKVSYIEVPASRIPYLTDVTFPTE